MNELELLGIEYHVDTENYDQLVSTQCNERGIAMPAPGWQYGLSRQNAMMTRQWYAWKMKEIKSDITDSEIDKIISRTARLGEIEWRRRWNEPRN